MDDDDDDDDDEEEEEEEDDDGWWWWWWCAGEEAFRTNPMAYCTLFYHGLHVNDIHLCGHLQFEHFQSHLAGRVKKQRLPVQYVTTDQTCCTYSWLMLVCIILWYQGPATHTFHISVSFWPFPSRSPGSQIEGSDVATWCKGGGEKLMRLMVRTRSLTERMTGSEVQILPDTWRDILS